jgi:hypothetical protein
MAGIDYERYRMQQVMGGVMPMSKDTWYSHQERVHRAIVEIAERKEGEYLQRLKDAEEPVVFCADASWSHRKARYDANQSWWVLMNANDKQIVLTVILMKSRWEKGKLVFKGNYIGSSGGMEGASLEKGIERLKAVGLLPQVAGWVCDKDSSVSEQLQSNPDTAHIPIHYDPGHIKKNFQKQLKQIYGERVRYEGMATRGGQCTSHTSRFHLNSSIPPPLLTSSTLPVCAAGDWFMLMIKRCEKEVPGSWEEKQHQAKTWLDWFVPHYCNRCRPDGGCPAKHTAPDQRRIHRQRSGDVGKRFLDEKDQDDQPKIAALHVLLEKMKRDVQQYIHGYNTCSVERANRERCVHTPKTVELWKNWRPKCRLVQLLHNHGVTATAQLIREQLGWQVTEEVRHQWRKVDRDKAKHRQIKSDPSYNRRKRQLEEERKARSAEAAAAAKEKKKKRKATQHTYHVRKQLLYPDVEKAGKEEASSSAGGKTRGRPRKRKAEEMDEGSSADKENIAGEENRRRLH